MEVDKTFVHKIRAIVEKKHREEINMVNRQYEKLLQAIKTWEVSCEVDEEPEWADNDLPF